MNDMHNVTLYPAPAGITPSHRYEVSVNGASSFTYLTTSPAEAEFTAGHTASWTSFDVRGPCEVRIRRAGRPVGAAVVRPLATGIHPRIENGDVVLHLDQPRKLCVECDGDLTDVLYLFANAPETEVPLPHDPNVVWFGPGIHEIGKFYQLQPATTYYLAPGAFLKGSLFGGGPGTRVIGRGVLSGADYKWPGHLQVNNAARVGLVCVTGGDLEFRGVTLVDSPYYVVNVGGANNRFSDLKVLGWYNNTDGISTGPGARIDDCFLRLADDAFKPYVSDTRITRCVLWVDTVLARPRWTQAQCDGIWSVSRVEANSRDGAEVTSPPPASPTLLRTSEIGVPNGNRRRATSSGNAGNQRGKREDGHTCLL